MRRSKGMALTNLINADKVSKMNKKPVGLKTIDIDDIEVNRIIS